MALRSLIHLLPQHIPSGPAESRPSADTALNTACPVELTDVKERHSHPDSPEEVLLEGNEARGGSPARGGRSPRGGDRGSKLQYGDRVGHAGSLGPVILAGAWARARGEVRYKQGLLEARRETRVAERAGRPLLRAACGGQGHGETEGLSQIHIPEPRPAGAGLAV